MQYLLYPTPEKRNPPSSPILHVFTHSSPAASERESLKKGEGLKFILQLELILKACYKEGRSLKSHPTAPFNGRLGLCWMHTFKSYRIRNNRHLSPCHNEAMVHIFNQPLLPFVPRVL